jgi:hypothetical protein
MNLGSALENLPALPLKWSTAGEENNPVPIKNRVPTEEYLGHQVW